MSAPHQRQAHVQGLRALAVVIVVAYHARAGRMSGGFVGVDVFFVISGYVISRLLFRELERSNHLRLGEFFTRRTRRLLPALTLTVLVVSAISTFLLSPLGPQQHTADTGTAAGLFGANLQLFGVRTGYFDLDSETNALLHTWSLGVEEQFYLVFPAVLALAWRWGARRRAVLVGVGIVSVASFGLSWLTSHGYLAALAHVLGGGIAKFAFYMPMTRAWEFGIGILVGLGVAHNSVSRTVAIACSVVGLAVVLAAAFAIDHATPFPGTAALAPTVGTALLLVGCLDGETPVARVLAIRPLVWIGDVSYSWYLWHWPPIVIARAWFPANTTMHLAAAIVGLIPAWLSYRYVEQPIRVAESWRGKRALLLVVTCIGISVVSSRASSFVASREREALPAELVAAALDAHAGATRGCANGPDDLHRCTTGPSDRREVILVGDSNADHFTEPVETAALARGYRFVIAARTACPFVDLLVHFPGRSAESCRAYVRLMAAELIERKPVLVVIASASSVYMNSDQVRLEDPGDRGSNRSRMWERGLRSIVTELASAGIPVLIVHTIPTLSGFNLATCPYAKMVGDPSACSITISRDVIEAEQREARTAEERAIAGIASARTLDVTDQLCSATECSARREGLWLYRDEGHLTVMGAKSLTPIFQRAMEAR